MAPQGVEEAAVASVELEVDELVEVVLVAREGARRR